MKLFFKYFFGLLFGADGLAYGGYKLYNGIYYFYTHGFDVKVTGDLFDDIREKIWFEAVGNIGIGVWFILGTIFITYLFLFKKDKHPLQVVENTTEVVEDTSNKEVVPSETIKETPIVEDKQVNENELMTQKGNGTIFSDEVVDGWEEKKETLLKQKF